MDQTQTDTTDTGSAGTEQDANDGPPISAEESAAIQAHTDAQPEQVAGTPGLSLEQRLARVEEYLGFNRVFVHDADQPGDH